MFLKFPSINTDIDAKVTEAFNLYKDEIIALHQKEWKQEDIRGSSTVQYRIVQYYYAMVLAVLIYLETKKGVYTDWSYYEQKYNISSNTKKLACNSIDLDEILAIFNLPLTSITECDGIGGVGLSANLVIEEICVDTAAEVLDIAHILATPSECTNHVTVDC